MLVDIRWNRIQNGDTNNMLWASLCLMGLLIYRCQLKPNTTRARRHYGGLIVLSIPVDDLTLRINRLINNDIRPSLFVLAMGCSCPWISGRESLDTRGVCQVFPSSVLKLCTVDFELFSWVLFITLGMYSTFGHRGLVPCDVSIFKA